jgi:AcrR family transcriptional regulator
MPRPPRPPVRADGDATRESLLQAATALFADLGFAGTSVRAVAARAEANLAAVTYYFGGKSELYLACIEYAHSALMADVPPLDIESLTLHDAVRTLFQWGLETADRVRGGNGSAHRLLLHAAQEVARGSVVAPALQGLAERMTQPFLMLVVLKLRDAYPHASSARIERAASLIVFNAVLINEELNLSRFGIASPVDAAGRRALATDLSDFVLAGARAVLLAGTAPNG